VTTTGTPRGAIDIGHVIQTLFAVLGRNFLNFFVLSLILSGLPSAVVGLLQTELVRGSPGVAFFNTWTLLGLAVAIVSAMVLQGTLVFGTVSDLNGKRPAISESLAVGLRAFLPLIGIAILGGLGVIVGFVLLIVPGIVLMVVWSVVAPAYVAEGRGLFEAFSRSVELTRGNRWRIFGLGLIYFVAIILMSLVIGALGGVVTVAAREAGPLVTAVVVNPLYNALSAMIGATGAAVLYVELRRAKEGLGADALAAIFD
jgi:hypothetical protein